MAYPGDKTNYPAGLNMINRPTQRQWPVVAPFKSPLIQNLPSIIANGVDRTYLPQVEDGPIRKGLREILRARGFKALTVKNIPNTLGGTQTWYPGALVNTLPSVVSDIASASGPRRTMSGQYTDWQHHGKNYSTNHRNYNLNPECVVEI